MAPPVYPAKPQERAKRRDNSPLQPIKFYALTIYKAQRKEYVKFNIIYSKLIHFCKTFNLHLVDYGYHISGRYRQCHMHAIVQTKGKVTFRPISIMSWTYKFLPYFSNTYHNGCPYWRYIHKEDHARLGQIENLKIKNYSKYHYMFI